MQSSPVYHSHFGSGVYYKMGRNLDRSDLTELRLRVQITSDGVVKEKHLWQEFRGMEHIMYKFILDNLMHFLEYIYMR